jgi:hypothetical protein
MTSGNAPAAGCSPNRERRAATLMIECGRADERSPTAVNRIIVPQVKGVRVVRGGVEPPTFRFSGVPSPLRPGSRRHRDNPAHGHRCWSMGLHLGLPRNPTAIKSGQGSPRKASKRRAPVLLAEHSPCRLWSGLARGASHSDSYTDHLDRQGQSRLGRPAECNVKGNVPAGPVLSLDPGHRFLAVGPGPGLDLRPREPDRSILGGGADVSP